MKFCPVCGAAREGKFCGSCGFHYANETTPHLPTEPHVVSPPPVNFSPAPVTPMEEMEPSPKPVSTFPTTATTNQPNLAPQQVNEVPVAQQSVATTPSLAQPLTRAPLGTKSFTRPQGLTYGQSFTPQMRCHNCGAKAEYLDRCGLCMS